MSGTPVGVDAAEEEVAARLRRAIEDDPMNAAANREMGDLLAGRHQYRAAAAHHERAEHAEPHDARHPWAVGRLHLENGTPEEGIAALLRGRILDPSSVPLLLDIARTHDAIGNPQAAVPYLHEALGPAPRDPLVHAHLGHVMMQLGDFATAERHLRTALARGGDRSFPLFSLSMFTRGPAAERLLDDVRTELARAETRSPAARRLHQAAAMSHQRLGHIADAVHHMLAAKAHNPVTFDRDAHARAHEATRRIFSATFLTSARAVRAPREAPIFVVGMPRSGSSLLESMLSAHPDLVGLGERNYVDAVAHHLWYHHGDPDEHERRVRGLTVADSATLADEYLRRARLLAPDGRRTIDKMLSNYRHIGLILLMFPKARFLHCRRDALDTCVSIYMNPIDQHHPYSARLADLAWVYARYRSMMDHWRSVAPDVLIDVTYEDLVQEPRREITRVLDFLSLPWDDRCLDREGHTGPVQTMSMWQVRQGLFDTSIGRGKLYREHLRPLVDALRGEGILPREEHRR